MRLGASSCIDSSPAISVRSTEYYKFSFFRSLNCLCLAHSFDGASLLRAICCIMHNPYGNPYTSNPYANPYTSPCTPRTAEQTTVPLDRGWDKPQSAVLDVERAIKFRSQVLPRRLYLWFCRSLALSRSLFLTLSLSPD